MGMGLNPPSAPWRAGSESKNSKNEIYPSEFPHLRRGVDNIGSEYANKSEQKLNGAERQVAVMPFPAYGLNCIAGCPKTVALAVDLPDGLQTWFYRSRTEWARSGCSLERR